MADALAVDVSYCGWRLRWPCGANRANSGTLPRQPMEAETLMLRNLVLAACCTVAVLGPVGSARAKSPEKIPAYISAAVADAGRPAEDKQADADRKPAETLSFTGIKPGEKVVELVPSRGYFTRL